MLNAPDVLCVLNVLNVLKDTSLAGLCFLILTMTARERTGLQATILRRRIGKRKRMRKR